jgi:hypothetical protein
MIPLLETPALLFRTARVKEAQCQTGSESADAKADVADGFAAEALF